MNKLISCIGNFLLLLSLINLLGSCEVVNPEEGIPSFIRIDTVGMFAQSDEGTANQRIRDVWVTVGGQAIGGFPLPAEIPVLASGEQIVELDYGVIENGISALRTRYPFFERDRITVDLLAGEVVELTNLSATYRPGSEISIDYQNWDSGSTISFESVLGNDLQQGPAEDAFEGNSGRVLLTDTAPFSEIGSSIPNFRLDESTGTTFMEINYKNDKDIAIGIIGYDEDENVMEGTVNYFLGLKARDTWNKVYVNFTQPISILRTTTGVKGYQILIAGNLVPGETEPAALHYDNIKLLRLK